MEDMLLISLKVRFAAAARAEALEGTEVKIEAGKSTLINVDRYFFSSLTTTVISEKNYERY